PLSATTLDQRLADAGFAPRLVHTVVVTHSHIDHFGGAARFGRAGARVITHESFQNWFELDGEQQLVDAEPGADDDPEDVEPRETAELIDRIVEFAPVVPWSNERWEIPLIDRDRVAQLLEYDPDFFAFPTPTLRL